MLARAARPSGRPWVGNGAVDRIAWAVATVARYVPGASCLTQAFATQIILARAGEISDLRIGVTRNGAGQVRAHAWLESHDRIVIGAPVGPDVVPLPGLHGTRLEVVAPTPR
jgi:hypothetical protein